MWLLGGGRLDVWCLALHGVGQELDDDFTVVGEVGYFVVVCLGRTWVVATKRHISHKRIDVLY